MRDSPVRGRCLCGATGYRFEGPPRWVAYCHCDSCRRATGAPVSAYLGVGLDTFAWHGNAPRYHASSAGVRRGNCARCGSPLSYEADRWPDEIHLHVSSLEDPGRFPPTLHVYSAEKIAWFDCHDALPRFTGTAGRGARPAGHGPAGKTD